MENENALIIGVVVLCALIAGILLMGGGMFSGSGGMMEGYGLFGGTFMILILIALILFIVWLIKQIGGQGGKK